MVSYSLYKAVVAGPTGLIGRHITKQLLLSPLCHSVIAVSREGGRARLEADLKLKDLPGASQKLRVVEMGEEGWRGMEGGVGRDILGAELEGAKVAYCTLGAKGGAYGEAFPSDLQSVDGELAMDFASFCAVSKIPHFTFVSSASVKAQPRTLKEAQNVGEVKAYVEGHLAELDIERVSIFRPSLVLPPANEEAGGLKAKMWRKIWPTMSQFRGSAQKEIKVEDLVMAMRLNDELCDPGASPEVLTYNDCMKIIGKEEMCLA